MGMSGGVKSRKSTFKNLEIGDHFKIGSLELIVCLLSDLIDLDADQLLVVVMMIVEQFLRFWGVSFG